MLEVIDKESPSESHPVPLLFVHGGEHAAWCWETSRQAPWYPYAHVGPGGFANGIP